MDRFAKLPRIIFAVVFIFAALIFPAFAADVAVPDLKARVTDLTSTLTAEQRAALESKLAAFEQRKGSQLAVLLVPTTQPETVEQYSIRVVEQWKIGRKGVDDGVLLLIAKNDRKLRIEVGRGLEGVIPDAIAKRIIDEYIAVEFKKGDFNAGINAGVDRMIKLVDGEPLPAPTAKSRGTSSKFSIDDWIGYSAILLIIFGSILRAIFGRVLGSLITGIVAGGLALFLGVGILGSLIISIVIFILAFIGIASGGRGGGGGYSSGGYSGGGGSFGGGGASGSW